MSTASGWSRDPLGDAERLRARGAVPWGRADETGEEWPPLRAALPSGQSNDQDDDQTTSYISSLSDRQSADGEWYHASGRDDEQFRTRASRRREGGSPADDYRDAVEYDAGAPSRPTPVEDYRPTVEYDTSATRRPTPIDSYRGAADTSGWLPPPAFGEAPTTYRKVAPRSAPEPAPRPTTYRALPSGDDATYSTGAHHAVDYDIDGRPIAYRALPPGPGSPVRDDLTRDDGTRDDGAYGATTYGSTGYAGTTYGSPMPSYREPTGRGDGGYGTTYNGTTYSGATYSGTTYGSSAAGGTTYNGTAYESTGYEQPAYDESAYQKPAYEEPAYDEPAYDAGGYPTTAYSDYAATEYDNRGYDRYDTRYETGYDDPPSAYDRLPREDDYTGYDRYASSPVVDEPMPRRRDYNPYDDDRPTTIFKSSLTGDFPAVTDDGYDPRSRGRVYGGREGSGRHRADLDEEERPSGRRSATRGRRQVPLWQELPLLVIIAFSLALVIKTFLLQAFFIPSGSMENTLLVKDRVLVNKVVYQFRAPQRGEVIVFRGTDSWAPETDLQQPNGFLANAGRTVGSLVGLGTPDEKDFIKRVIGVPGDVVQCCDPQGRLLVNGQPLDEDAYVFDNNPIDQRAFGPITVPQGRLFMMGDHRGNSQDSRAYVGDEFKGTIPIDQVIGRAFVKVWPVSSWDDLPVPGSFDAVPAARAIGPPEPGGGRPVPSGLGDGPFVAALLLPFSRRRLRRWAARRRPKRSRGMVTVV